MSCPRKSFGINQVNRKSKWLQKLAKGEDHTVHKLPKIVSKLNCWLKKYLATPEVS
jgi:hypothetical protein